MKYLGFLKLYLDHYMRQACMWDKRVVELIAKCESTSDQQDTIWSFVANGIFYGKYLISKPVVAF